MRFSDNGYYIERYIKCDNCGVLIYGDGLETEHRDHGKMLFCSRWCQEWKTQKMAGADIPEVPFDFTSTA
jgi:5-oxoprolinase (ATP-hydrolysing)/N-methylhydantoinase B